MKRSKPSEHQIVKVLGEYENGRMVEDICRELNIHRATFHNWKKKYSGMSGTDLAELKSLQQENARLKKMYADLALDHAVLKDVLSKKF